MLESKNHSERGGSFPNIVVDPNNINSSLLRSLNTEYPIQFSDWEKIKVQEIMDEIKIQCDILIKKYWFNAADGEKFKKGIDLHPFEVVPWHPSYRGICYSKVIRWDRNSLSVLSPVCKIYVNPMMVSNRDFYFAVMFHELDHHAFYFKKFLEKHIENIPSVEWKQNALDSFSLETTQDYTYSFCTELMARIDTADELMSKWISWNKVWEYWPGNEYETTWEAFYKDSILYAKKFLKFQIWLYNLLSIEFWLESNKRKNQQITQQADTYFQQIMGSLWKTIFNSTSIENIKYVINNLLTKLRNSRSRKEFASSINYDL